MNAVTTLADHPYAQALAWALLHFLWQGAVLGLAAMACFRIFRRSANARYVSGVVTLAAMLAAPVVTTIWIAEARSLAPATTASLEVAPAAGGIATATLGPSPAELATNSTPTSATQPLTGVVLAIWMIGVTALSIRLLGGWVTARRVARRALRPVTPEIHAMATRLADRLALARVVDVVESAGVAVPIMVGWLKPVIVLPTSVISGFTPDQVEALIVHELAHIRRNDYLVNLLQAAVETVLFYHPAVWWVSRRIRTEREHCCDDLAVTICDRLVYARALSDLAAMTQPTLAMAASSGSLVDRVRRILGREAGDSETGAGWLPVFLILAVMAPVLPATLKSADQAAVAVPVSVAQTPIPVASATTDAVPVRAADATPEAAGAKGQQQAVVTTSQRANSQPADQQRDAEIRRLEEILKRLADQQSETTNKAFDIAIAKNEAQMKAEIAEYQAKLKDLQTAYESAKRKYDVGLISDDVLIPYRQQMEQAQREIAAAQAKYQLESSQLLLERTQAEQKREYDKLLQEYAKLRDDKEYTSWKIVDAERAAEPVKDPNATAQPGDVIEIVVSGENELPGLTVDNDGTVRPPFIGSIQVKGLTTRQIAEAVAKRLTDRKLATNPQVSVTLRRR